MTDSPVPAGFDHCARVFAQMLKESTEETLPRPELKGDDADYEGDPDTIRVYEGHLTGLFQKLGIPNPYYTSVMKALKAMNCVEQVRRGGGPALSKWALLKEPTEEGYVAYAGNMRPNRHAGAVAALDQRLRAIERRQDRIEKYLAEEMDKQTRRAS